MCDVGRVHRTLQVTRSLTSTVDEREVEEELPHPLPPLSWSLGLSASDVHRSF